MVDPSIDEDLEVLRHGSGLMEDQGFDESAERFNKAFQRVRTLIESQILLDDLRNLCNTARVFQTERGANYSRGCIKHDQCRRVKKL
jgi:hypothetical protein